MNNPTTPGQQIMPPGPRPQINLPAPQDVARLRDVLTRLGIVLPAIQELVGLATKMQTMNDLLQHPEVQVILAKAALRQAWTAQK